MILRRLQLYRFRNYAAQTLDFEPGANLIVGPNGQGKTNLLEAVTLLATTRSSRATRDSEMLEWDAPEARVYGELERSARPDTALEVRLDRAEGKRIFINRASHPRLIDLIGQLNLVTFWVEDLEIARGDPSQRRRFLNTEICQVSPKYCYQLGGYRRVLEQRNRLLKQIAGRGASQQSLPVWNRQLVTYGAPLIERRREFVEQLQAPAAEAHRTLTNGKEELALSYESSFALDGPADQRYQEVLTRDAGDEIRRGVTLYGPHRDDLRFLINGRDARTYGSLGQQRSVTLSLRIAELQLVRDSIGEEPIVLMDDIFAELDRSRVERLLERVLPGRQAILATTEVDRLPAQVVSQSALFEVSAGAAARVPHA